MLLRNEKNYKFIRNGFAVIMSVLFLVILLIGIGIVDNAVKLSQNNPFLNGVFIDTDNYMLCFRYLSISVKIPFGIKGAINSAIAFIKPLFISILTLFVKIKGFF